jgi:hypothetical protein
MPTLQDLERQVRRRSLGRTFAEICLDLAVVPSFCTGPFWNTLFEIMHLYGGDGVVTLMETTHRREQAFSREQERARDSDWTWIRQTRAETRQILGFFVGEPPVDPFAASPSPGTPVAALATGPP